jgi:amidophosphoribosyltransferase
VKLIRDAGAREVHLRIGSPQVRYSCYYGIDTPDSEELVANRLTLDEICRQSGADSLRHLDSKDLKSCVGNPEHYCYACFDGAYPLGRVDE